ncbi:DNA polymerase III subunit gamma/tau [Glaciecola sp. HTCC2999]|uniref:DNA polymerase III subunit gamma/tau n=1 Tax=Glaciecola sp. HTCC2999 TaxID=455436 RepID=UPI0000E0E6B7|nr:DNA polymerase III subunit gamma/tau [Glaciecola sp. HTCC2999]
MSYQVLARKWRPNKFSELVGQEHVVTAISNALDNNRLHHAYLFTGTRGVGKTTIARIFAKSLNCDTGLSANPCGECGTCRDIEQGRFVDLLEIDAASRTKVDDTRELLDNVQYRPTQGDYKVYLIDEVHMLSKHSFNALLKTLEEPPPHVKFLLATTDPQKLPVTILSRCLQFNLKALSREQIQQQLSHVLTQEHINHEPAALAQLARAANGSMRDALSLTDQAIAQGNNQISTVVVSDMLGLMDKNQILKILHSMIEGDKIAVFEQVESLAQTSPNYAHVLDELMSLLHQIAMTQVVPEVCKLETISARAIYKLAGSISKEHVQLLYQMALNGKQDLPHSMDGRSGFEMVLLRMLAFTPVTPIDGFVDIIKTDMQNHIAEVGEMVTFAAEPEVVSPEPTILEAPVIEQEPKSTTNPMIESESAVDPKAQPETIVPYQSEVREEIDPEPTTAPEPVKEPVSVIVEDEENSAEKVDFSAVMNDMFSEPEPEPEPEQPQVSVSTLQGPDESAMFQEQAEIMHEAHEMHPSQFDEQSLPPEAYMNDDYSDVPIDVQVEQESQPQINTVASNAIDDLLALSDDLNTDSPSNESNESLVEKASINKLDSETPIVAEHKGESKPEMELKPELFEMQLDAVADSQTVPELNTTPIMSAPTIQTEPEVQAESLSQPERDPSKMGLVDNSELVKVTVQKVDVQGLQAILPNGDKLTSAAQIDEWTNVIGQLNLTGLNKQLAIHASFSREGDVVTLLLGQDKAHLHNETSVNALAEALSVFFDTSITLQVSFGEPINTPYALQMHINQIRNEYAQSILNSNPELQKLQSTFGTSVVSGTLKPKP